MDKLFTIMLCVYLFISPFSQAQDKNNIPRVPEWAEDAVWYQIFPERFANGDRTNDPTPHDMEGAWPYITPKGWHTTPWTSDRKSTRLNSSHLGISYAVFCLKKKK